MSNEKREKILLLVCWFIYVASYTSRYSYNSNIVAIKDFYDVTNGSTGLVSTCFFFAYGIGQIIISIVCGKLNKKIFLSLPLLISSIINLILFFEPPFYIYKYLWLINGLSLSILWALIILTLSQNIEEKNLSKSVVIMSSTVAAGTVITYGASSLFNLVSSFKYSFLLGSIMSLIAATIWFTTSDKLLTTNGIFENKNNNEEIISKTNSRNKFIIISIVLFAVFMAIDNLIKDGITTWVPQILKDTFNISNSLSIILTLFIPILGLFGAIFVVKLSKVIKNNVLLCGVLFFSGGIIILISLLAINNKLLTLIITAFGLISLVSHSINNFLTSFVPLKMRDKFNSGTLAGILNGSGYIGSTISAYTLGTLADNKGWNTAIILLLVISFIAALMSFSFYLYIKITKKEQFL